MPKAVAFGVSLITILLGASVAFANGPPAPAWCKVDGRLEQGFVESVRKDDDVVRSVRSIVYLMCSPQYVESADVADITAAYKKMTTRLEMTEAEWSEMAQFTTTRGDLDIFPIDAKAKWSSLAPIDQYAYIQRPHIEVPGLMGETDYAYVADAFGAHLSELGRLSYVERCLERGKSAVDFAMCQPDMDAFDMHKIIAELRADKTHSPVVHAIIRLTADRVRDKIPARREEIKKLIAKDPTAYNKLFGLADVERKAWDKRWHDSADLLAVQDLMDDAMVSNSRRATDGCHDKTWNALKAVVAKLPAKSFATKRIPDREYEFVTDVTNRVVDTIVADPSGFLAASAYTECEQLDPPKQGGTDNLAAMFSASLSRFPGYRGPRSSTYSAILLAGIELDDRSARIEFPQISRIWFKNGGKASGPDGVVESVKTKGDEATVTFAQKLEKETVDTGCTRSNHVVGIRDNGSIEYEYNCTGSKTVSYDHRPKPQTVKARYAGGLKAGNVVALNADIVWMAWPKSGTPIPSFVLGQAVK